MRVLCITSHRDTLNSIRPEAELLIGLRRAGVEMDVMTNGDTVYADRFAREGIGLIDYVPRKKFQLDAIRTIRRLLREKRHDIVYAFNNKAITNAIQAARGLPVKIVTYRGQTGNVHWFDPACYFTHLNRRVDRVLCVADAVRDSVARNHRWPERVMTVYKGHDLDWYNDRPASLQDVGIPPRAFVVGCVANNRPRKGLPVLLGAAAHLAAEKEIHFLLIGGGMETLDTGPPAGDGSHRVHKLGFRTDAPALIAACDMTVLPALKREGLPKVVIESMVYSVPCVVSDTGGCAELVESGVSGIVVPPGDSRELADAILKLKNDADLRRRMGVAARRRIETEFSLTRSVEKTRKIFLDLLQSA